MGAPRKCQNEIYHTDPRMPVVKCNQKATVIRARGTVWEIALCTDCANGGEKLERAAIEKFTAVFALLSQSQEK